MAIARYEFHQEASDAAEHAWTLFFDVGAGVWAVEHMWRRRDPQTRQTLSVGKETHSIPEFKGTRKGRRLAECLDAAIARAAF